MAAVRHLEFYGPENGFSTGQHQLTRKEALTVASGGLINDQ